MAVCLTWWGRAKNIGQGDTFWGRKQSWDEGEETGRSDNRVPEKVQKVTSILTDRGQQEGKAILT